MPLPQISSGTVDSVAVVGWSGDLFSPGFEDYHYSASMFIGRTLSLA